MTTHYKTQAFIFKKSNLNESDNIFSVFSKDYGRLELKAKAVRKITSKLRPDIDMFYFSEVEFIQGKNAKTLTDAKSLERFFGLTQNLEKFEIANKIAQVLDGFIRGQEKDKAIFDLINETFTRLNNYTLDPKPYTLIYYYFLWNFLFLLGYKPEADKCVSCRGKLNPYSLYFSDKLGGVICGNCEKKACTEGAPFGSRRINSDIVKIMRLIFKKEWQILSKLKIEDSSQESFQNLSDSYCSYTLSSHSFDNVKIN